MSFDNLILEAEKFKLSKEIGGKWATLQLKLSSFSPEYLNVGVIFWSDSGDVHWKLLDDLTGLSLLMPNQFDEKQFNILKEISIESIKRSNCSADFKLPSPSLRLSNFSFFSGSSPESIVNWLFEESITLARCKRSRKGSSFITKNDGEVVKGLIDQIKKKDGINADKYIQRSSFQKEDSSGIIHSMNVPFMTENKVATIANAWVKSWETIKLKVFEAQTDLSAVSKLSSREGTLFIQRPDVHKGLSASELGAIEENLDELVWKIEKSGYSVEAGLGADQLSDLIIGWADVA